MATEPHEHEGDAEGVDSTRMTLGEHLDELRSRLFKGVLAVAIAFIAGYSFRDQIAAVVLEPLDTTISRLNAEQVERLEADLAESGEPRSKYFVNADAEVPELRDEYVRARNPITTGAGETFLFAIKITLFFALLVGSPVLLWQVWQFIAAGLYQRERKALLKYFPFAVLLLLMGISFGYLVMLPWAMYFLVGTLGPQFATFTPKLSEYLTLVTNLTLALGAVFQLPILIHALVRLDIVPRSTFTRYRPHFIVGAFFLSALLTPPDPFTQGLMAIPMIFLFEIGILSSRIGRRPERKPA